MGLYERLAALKKQGKVFALDDAGIEQFKQLYIKENIETARLAGLYALDHEQIEEFITKHRFDIALEQKLRLEQELKDPRFRQGDILTKGNLELTKLLGMASKGRVVLYIEPTITDCDWQQEDVIRAVLGYEPREWFEDSPPFILELSLSEDNIANAVFRLDYLQNKGVACALLYCDGKLLGQTGFTGA